MSAVALHEDQNFEVRKSVMWKARVSRITGRRRVMRLVIRPLATLSTHHIHHPKRHVVRFKIGAQEQRYMKSISDGAFALAYIVRILVHIVILIVVWIPLLTISLPLLLHHCPDVYRNCWWKLCCEAVQWSGPLWVKLAQWASTRPDIFSWPICHRLSGLQNNVNVHSFSHTAQVLATAFGENWSRELFIDETPIGSGCVAQVHKGTLHGQDVVVKVMHPGVRDLVQFDLALLHGVCRFFDRIKAGDRFIGWMAMYFEFEHLMMQQLDFRVEARNLVRFAHNFKNQTEIQFPTPIQEWVAPEVFVETFADGVSIHSFAAGERSMAARKSIARSGLESFLKMVFQDNFVHGDLHGGNILVQDDLSMVFLDTGIVTVLVEEDRRNFVDLFRALIQRDGYYAGELLLDRSSQQECPDRDAFCTEVSSIVHDALSTNLKLSEVHVGSLLQRLLQTCYTNKVLLEPRFVSIVLATILLEGIGRSLDPDLDILKVAAPFVSEAPLLTRIASKVLTTEQLGSFL